MAVACTMGAEPIPASLENTPRAMPLVTASFTDQPARAPGSAIGSLKAYFRVDAMASGMCCAFFPSTRMEHMTKKTAMKGTR